MSDVETSNPYEAPKASETRAARISGPVTDERVAGVAPFRPLAVVLGMVVDLGLTFLVSRAQVVIASARFSSIQELALFWQGIEHRLEFLPFGAACSLAGGYVTGALARHREMTHAFGNVCMSALYFAWLWGTDSMLPFEPAWLSMLEHGTIVVAIFAGAGLARRRRRSHP